MNITTMDFYRHYHCHDSTHIDAFNIVLMSAFVITAVTMPIERVEFEVHKFFTDKINRSIGVIVKEIKMLKYIFKYSYMIYHNLNSKTNYNSIYLN